MRAPVFVLLLTLASSATLAQSPTTLTTNPTLGLPLSPYDVRTSPYSPIGARNPYTSQPPTVVYRRRPVSPTWPLNP